jgi:3-polyprenyl-4-hydroxybenzoate decarboxylase
MVVASINTPCVYDVKQLLITFDDLIIQVISAAEMLSAYSTLVLPCSSWTCAEIALGYTSLCLASSNTTASHCVD